MSRKIILLNLLLSFSLIIIGQNKLVIFNKDGQIVKSFGESNGNSFQENYHSGFKLVIEDVDLKDKDKYYLVYQARKSDYIYGSNLTSFERLIEKFEFDENQNILKLNLHRRLSREVISYQLVKTNDWGKDKEKFEAMVLSSNWFNYYSDTIHLKESLMTYLEKNFFVTAKEVFAFNDSYEKYYTAKSSFDKKKYSVNNLDNEKYTQRELIKNKISILEKKLEKITGLARSESVISSFDELNESLIKLNAELILIDKDLINFRRDDSIKLNLLSETYKGNRKGINFDFHKENFIKTENYTAEAPFTILHQGSFINSTDKTKEVVYTAYQQDIFNSGQKNLSVKRLSPELPQLTTDDDLYIKLVNVDYRILKENPFLFQINIDNSKTATEAELVNGPMIKGMDEIAVNPFINIVGMSGTKDIFNKSNISIFKSNSENTPNVDDVYKMWYTEINSILNPTLQQVAKWNNLELKTDTLYKLDKDEVTRKKYMEAKIKLKQFSDMFIYFANLVYSEIIPSKIEEPKYLDFLLKNDKPFQYSTKPIIELKSLNFVMTDYALSVVDGVAKKPSYSVKSEISSLVKDELAPVRKRYLFNVNAGVVFTPILSYTYSQELIAGSQTSYYLKEKSSLENKFVPTLFFSTYIGANDIYEKISKTNWYHRIHLDVGIDYADTKLLDNFYFGAGFEPFRTLHIVGGVRVGNVTRISMNEVNPVTLDITNAQEKTLDYQPYFGVSFGFNLIPMAIKSLITK